MAGISALSRSVFKDANRRKFDISDSRRLGQRRKIFQIAVGHDAEGDDETGNGERKPSIKQFVTALWHPEGNETDEREPKIGKKEQDGIRERVRRVSQGDPSGRPARRKIWSNSIHTHKVKGQKTGPRRLSRTNIDFGNMIRRATGLGHEDRPASYSRTI